MYVIFLRSLKKPVLQASASSRYTNKKKVCKKKTYDVLLVEGEEQEELSFSSQTRS